MSLVLFDFLLYALSFFLISLRISVAIHGQPSLVRAVLCGTLSTRNVRGKISIVKCASCDKPNLRGSVIIDHTYYGHSVCEGSECCLEKCPSDLHLKLPKTVERSGWRLDVGLLNWERHTELTREGCHASEHVKFNVQNCPCGT